MGDSTDVAVRRKRKSRDAGAAGPHRERVKVFELIAQQFYAVVVKAFRVHGAGFTAALFALRSACAKIAHYNYVQMPVFAASE